MNFYIGQRVRFKSQQSDHWFTGQVVRRLQDGFYLIDDGTGRVPRTIHGNRLGAVEIPKCEVFA